MMTSFSSACDDRAIILNSKQSTTRGNLTPSEIPVNFATFMPLKGDPVAAQVKKHLLVDQFLLSQ
jgi:hypothetical protein